MEVTSNDKPIRISVDGSGARPDGRGSCFAYLWEETRQSRIERIDGLSSNQSEYHAVRLGLESVPDHSKVEILTDSQLVSCQFNGVWRVSDPTLADLLAQIRDVIEKKHLAVILTWIPRQQNRAGKLI